MNIKIIITFIGGLVIGGGLGVIGTKKYFEEKYQKRYEEDHDALEEYYHRTDEYYRKDDSDEENEVNPTESDSRPGGRMGKDERKKIKEKLNKQYGIGAVNYVGMYKNVDHRDHSMYDSEASLAEEEHPLDQGEDGEIGPETLKICANCANYDGDSEECVYHEIEVSADNEICSDFTPLYHSDVKMEEEAFDEHQKNKDRSPKIISAEAYSNLPAYIDQGVLYFYAYDEMLCDDNEEPIEEPERIVGDALTKYGFIDNDERIIFVMNYALDTCYEIQKVDASWTDSH